MPIKYLDIDIDSNLVDSDLTDFPLLIHLGTQSGQTSADVSDVFTTVGASSGIIDVQDAGGVSLPVEIEKWDVTGQEAYLWTKVPQVSASVDTNIKLYYTDTQSVNLLVGDTGTAAGSGVWTNGYKSVYHLREGGSTPREDSLVAVSAEPINNPSLINGKIDGSNSFDGVDEYIKADGLITTCSAVTSGTISFWARLDSSYAGGNTCIGFTNSTAATRSNIYMYFDMSANRKWFDTYVHKGSFSLSWRLRTPQDSMVAHIDKWLHVTVVQDRVNPYFYFNGEPQTQNWNTTTDKSVWLSDIINHPTHDADIVRFAAAEFEGGGTHSFLPGDLDEIRIDNIARSADWIKADYNSQNDSLLTIEPKVIRIFQTKTIYDFDYKKV